MKFLVVARSKVELDKLTAKIREAEPEANVTSKNNFDDARTLVRKNEFDVIFADPDNEKDIKVADIVAEAKSRSQGTHAVFVSNSESHMPDAFRVHADAYIMKPVKVDDIRNELDYMMNHYPTPVRRLELTVQTFGVFNAFVHGRKLHFKRSKSKELLAILVDNRGIGLSTREVCSMLFHGRKYDEILLGYYHVVLTSLKSTLEEAGIRNLIRKTVNYIAIRPEIIDCDMYNYLRGDPDAVDNYHGDYMSTYSWSDYSSRQFEDVRKEALFKERKEKKARSKREAAGKDEVNARQSRR